jgi:phosphohistidine phosphatase SixA
MRCYSRLALMALALTFGATAFADSLSGPSLVSALRDGGYVIVMRHPSSPFTPPDKATAEPDNTKQERQLDETGRNTATAMGDAMRKLQIPVGEVLSSPTYRAVQAVKLAKFGKPKLVAELNEGEQGMMANADAARSAWLRRKIAEAPRAKTDTIIVTHTPNLTGAFAADAANMAAGEALIFHPDGKGNSPIVARIKIEDWPKLTASP